MRSYRRRRRIRAAARAACRAVVFLAVRPRLLAGPVSGAAALGAALLLHPVEPWVAAALGVLLVAPAAVLTVHAALPGWRRAARWVAIVAAVVTVVTAAPWVALVVTAAVVVAVVELPTLIRVETDGEYRELPAGLRPRAITHRARQRGRSVATRTLRTWTTRLEQGTTRDHARADRPTTRLPAPSSRTSTRPSTRADTADAADHAPLRAPVADTAALDQHAPHTISVTVTAPSHPPREPLAHVRWLLERAGDDGCTPVELYTAVGRSRSWWSPIARNADWMERGEDGRYRLARSGAGSS